MESSILKQAAPTQNRDGTIRVYRRALPEFWQRIDVNPYGVSVPPQSIDDAAEALSFSLRLDRILTARRRSGTDTVLMGGPSEPYPIAERQRRVTRIVLEVLAKHDYPVLIITGSTLILRDVDILREINESSAATVAMSIPTLHATLLRQMQPRSTKLAERLHALERICRSGVQTGLVIWPHLPNLNDRPKDITGFFKLAREIGLDFILIPFADGSFYRRWWKESENPKLPRAKLNRSLLERSHESHIRLRPGRYIPKDYRKENYWLAGKLADEAYRLRLLGQPFRAHLSAAGIINDLKHDVRSLLKLDGMSALPTLPATTIPDVERLLQGVWADEFDVRA